MIKYEEIVSKLPEFARYRTTTFKNYVHLFYIIKLMGIFKYNFNKAVNIYSNSYKNGYFKIVIRKICRQLNIDPNDTLKYCIDHYNFNNRPLRKIKKLSTSKEYRNYIKLKTQKTKLERYGDPNYTNLEKAKQTKFERHGYMYFDREHTKEVCLEKYGATSPFGSKIIQEKIKQTNLKNLGVENPFESKEIQEKIKQTNLKNYGYEYYFQSDDYKEKTKSTNLEKYGTKHHLQKDFKNIENLNETFVKENFIKDERFLIDDFMDYFNILSPITAKTYKEKFNINLLNKFDTEKDQQFIFDSINVENKIYNDRHLSKELDIYLPDYNLAIEYDGVMFHSEGYSDYSMFKDTNKNYHLEKTELCLENDIQLLHIFEGEDLELWLSMINSKLGLNNKIFARKCIIKELKSKETEDFLNKNHLQGFCQAKINIGLFYEDKLVSVMSFSKPRFNKKYEYELIRFASKRNYTVIGGASKLWNYFVNKYSPNSVITYANRRFSNGDLYYKLGFKFIEKTQPNYFYFSKQHPKLEPRIKFQKHKLKDILEVYDENLSEAENMFNNKYRRIFDSGNLKFEWINQR